MEKSKTNKRISKYAAYILPAVLAGFCVLLYFVSAAGKQEGDIMEPLPTATAQTGEDAPPAQMVGAADFIESAYGFGLNNCTQLSSTAFERTYSIADEYAQTELTLSLKEGCVEAFSLRCILPEDEHTGSDILNDIAQQRDRAAAEWIKGCASALIRALDGGRSLTAGDMDAFLLAIDSTFYDKSTNSSTVSGVTYTVAAGEADGGRTLHISAALTGG